MSASGRPNLHVETGAWSTAVAAKIDAEEREGDGPAHLRVSPVLSHRKSSDDARTGVDSGTSAPTSVLTSVKAAARRATVSVFGAGSGDDPWAEPHSASHVDTLRRSGSFQGKEPFEAFDMLESGHARELASEECLRPATHDERWTLCYVLRIQKTRYKLFSQNSHRFMLSALKHADGSFYISQYDTFPEDVESGEGPHAPEQAGVFASATGSGGTRPPRSGYCAVLRPDPQEGKNFKLWLCGCEDPGTYYELERFPTHTIDAAAEQRIDGQLLADVTHFSKHVKGADAEMRAMRLTLPAIDASDRRSRVLWVPRAEPVMPMSGLPPHTPGRPPRLARSNSLPGHLGRSAGGPGGQDGSDAVRGSGNAHALAKGSPSDGSIADTSSSGGGAVAEALAAGRSQAASASCMGDGAGAGGDGGGDGGDGKDSDASGDMKPFEVQSRLPEWNDNVGSLVLRFSGGRVQCASAKNFLLAEKAKPERAVLQFGKSHKGRFALDFKYPLAPLQAFGIALSACNWKSNS